MKMLFEKLVQNIHELGSAPLRLKSGSFPSTTFASRFRPSNVFRLPFCALGKAKLSPGRFLRSERDGYNLRMPSTRPVRNRRFGQTTEERNPASKNLDRKSALEIVRLMSGEDEKVARAVRREIPAIANAVEAIAARLQSGGRLIYVGAGTSGRIGILDASECPPTFGVSPNLVRGVIAGGKRAITKSIEGAEDRSADGARDLRRLHATKLDSVVGIAASGTTPYVLGAINYAKHRGALTVSVTADRRSAIARAAQITITPEVGPEILAGSTRLKAGTSQKMVLNMLSTAVPALRRVEPARISGPT